MKFYQNYNKQILSENIALPPSGGQTIGLDIDDAVGVDTIMTFTWTTSTSIEVIAYRPGGEVIDDDDHEYNLDSSSKIITITIEEAEVGIIIGQLTRANDTNN